ncbi:uncharacterized protein PG998_015085 [Apiospora kogelbergensis]|uniref:uncharacterized protein n=1 Tax=Apiospora kogelbergensis TaxID=1337665 RepID=UPI00312F3C12
MYCLASLLASSLCCDSTSWREASRFRSAYRDKANSAWCWVSTWDCSAVLLVLRQSLLDTGVESSLGRSSLLIRRLEARVHGGLGRRELVGRGIDMGLQHRELLGEIDPAEELRGLDRGEDVRCAREEGPLLPARELEGLQGLLLQEGVPLVEPEVGGGRAVLGRLLLELLDHEARAFGIEGDHLGPFSEAGVVPHELGDEKCLLPEQPPDSLHGGFLQSGHEPAEVFVGFLAVGVLSFAHHADVVL